jgi:hypothetical protein
MNNFLVKFVKVGLKDEALDVEIFGKLMLLKFMSSFIQGFNED